MYLYRKEEPEFKLTIKNMLIMLVAAFFIPALWIVMPSTIVGVFHTLSSHYVEPCLILVVLLAIALQVCLPLLGFYINHYRIRVKGRLDADDTYSRNHEKLTGTQKHAAREANADNLQKILDVLKETSISHRPLARSVWKLEDVDRQKCQAKFVLYCHDPCRTNQYVRQIRLSIQTYPGRLSDAVLSKYEILTPGMLKQAKRAIAETEDAIDLALNKVEKKIPPPPPAAEQYTIFNDYTYSC